MTYIDFKSVQAAKERLSEQISILRELKNELIQTEYKIRDMAYMDETIYLLLRSRDELQEEINTLRCMVQCLEEAAEMYRKTEQRIADTYDLESVVYPKTKFGTSRISGLDGYGELLAFRQV